MGKIFRNTYIDGQARLFNKTVFNFSINYILNKYVTYNGKDSAWLNHHVRVLIKKKNVVFQKYLRDGRTNASYTNLKAIKVELTDAINLSKIKCFKRPSDKSKGPTTPSKTFKKFC